LDLDPPLGATGATSPVSASIPCCGDRATHPGPLPVLVTTEREPMSALSYPEAIFAGLLQGVSELFPVSSLGHGVLVPALIGGKWAQDMNMSVPNSPYLDVLVAMHVATAAALVIFFWHDWVRIVKGLFTAIRYRSIETPDERLAVLLVVATIPVGLAGVVLDKVVREDLGKPIPAAI